MPGTRRQRRSLEWWRALLARFASSGQTVAAFVSVRPPHLLFDGLAVAPARSGSATGCRSERP